MIYYAEFNISFSAIKERKKWIANNFGTSMFYLLKDE